MSQLDIFELEKANTDKIYLYLEGNFWKAYEHSAYMFVTQVRAYSIKKKYIKYMQSELVSIGFPKVALESVMKGFELLEKSEKRIVFKVSKPFAQDEFDKWKKSVPLQTILSGASHEKKSVESIGPDIRDQVFVLVEKFNLATNTPVDSMNFIRDLQRMIMMDRLPF